MGSTNPTEVASQEVDTACSASATVENRRVDEMPRKAKHKSEVPERVHILLCPVQLYDCEKRHSGGFVWPGMNRESHCPQRKHKI